MFYGYVPTLATGSSADFNVRAVWDLTMPATVIHETKHITATAERFADPLGDLLDESWMEEGTAQVAAELFGRTVYGANSGVEGPMRPTTTACSSTCATSRTTSWPTTSAFCCTTTCRAMRNIPFSRRALRMGTSTCSGCLRDGCSIERYSTQESDILKPLIADATMAGVDNVTNKTGRSWAELAGFFTRALAADDNPGFTPPAGAKYLVPSWNLRSIYAGFNADFGSQFAALAVGGPHAVVRIVGHRCLRLDWRVGVDLRYHGSAHGAAAARPAYGHRGPAAGRARAPHGHCETAMSWAAAGVVALVLGSACHGGAARGEEILPAQAPSGQAADTARGIVAVVGSEHSEQVVLKQAPMTRSITLTGPLEPILMHTSGADVWVTGTRAGNTLEVRAFVVRPPWMETQL